MQNTMGLKIIDSMKYVMLYHNNIKFQLVGGGWRPSLYRYSEEPQPTNTNTNWNN